MLIATECLGSVGVGVTAPQFFRANDQKVYVVKLQNNRLGPKVLANELIAVKLGEMMGLCFPPSSIIEINEQTFQKEQGPLTPEINIGRHFASLYLEHTEYVGKDNLYKVANSIEMAGVLLFDHMFHNADRANNRKNLLIRQENADYKIYAIDHSHLFRSGKWTLESLQNMVTKIKIYYRYSFGLLLRDYLSPQDFVIYLEKIESISNEDLESIIEEIPNEWLPDKFERQGLVSHIKKRRDLSVEIWHALCNYIPKTRGGKSWLLGRKFPCP